MTVVERIVALCCRFPWAVIAACLLLGGGAAWYTSQNFAMNTDSEQLIDAKVGWRMRQARFDADFPQQSNITVAVIDGTTPELAESAAARLTEQLSANPKLFTHVRRPDGAFFNQNGLLFLPLKEVQDTTQQLIKAQPFLGSMAADPSLRGIAGTLSTALLGIKSGDAKLADLDAPMARFADVFEAAAKGEVHYMSWRSLITNAPPRPEELRHFIMVKPRLDFSALEPGLEADSAIRAAVKDLDLTQDHGVRVRLTGPVPLSDEEFATLTDRAGLMAAAMMGSVLLILWLALRSFKIISAILVTLVVGLALTMGIGLFLVGVFNIISIAFIALFVGLGVDFGIQFAVRYRHERHNQERLDLALEQAGRGVGIPLALAAAATAAGFFSFLPTTYTGVAELGKVAGIGMIMAFLLSITMLPALLMLLNPPGEVEDVGFQSLARLDDFMTAQRKNVVRVAAAAGVVSLALMAFVRFDSNPLDLRSPKVESVSTLFDLMKNPQTSPNTIDVPALSLTDADAVAARIAQEPLVAQTLTLSSFVPDQQQQKLALISDANSLLDSTINPLDVAAAPSTADDAAALTATAQKLQEAAGKAQDKPARDARRLADAMQAVARGGKDAIARARQAFVPGLKTMLGQVSDSLKAQPVSIAEHAGGFQGRLDRGRRHRPHPGLSQGHQQQYRGALGLFRPGAERGAAGHRRAHFHPGIRQDHRRRLRGGGRAVLPGDQHSAGAGAAQPARCADDPGAAGAGRPSDPGDLRAAGIEAQFRQCDRPAAALGHRRRLQHLFRGGLAPWPALLPGLQPHPGGDLLGRHHRVRLRHPVAVGASGHRQHGRAVDDLAGLGAGDDTVPVAGVVGAAAAYAANARSEV